MTNQPNTQAPKATITITEGADGNIRINLHCTPRCDPDDPHLVHVTALRMVNLIYEDGGEIVSAGVAPKEDKQ